MNYHRFAIQWYFIWWLCTYLPSDSTVAKKWQNCWSHTSLRSLNIPSTKKKKNTSCNWRGKAACIIFSGKTGIVRSEKSIVTRYFFAGWEFSSSSPLGRIAWAECLLRSFSLCHTKACQGQGEKVNMLCHAQQDLRKWKWSASIRALERHDWITHSYCSQNSYFVTSWRCNDLEESNIREVT